MAPLPLSFLLSQATGALTETAKSHLLFFHTVLCLPHEEIKLPADELWQQQQKKAQI